MANHNHPAAPRLRLRLLGGCDFDAPGGPVRPETAKTSALLVYLAMNPGPQQRHKLVGLLWGDLPEERARRNLRRALWDLRRRLPPAGAGFIAAARQTAAFNRENDYWLDAELFETAARRGADEAENQAAITALRQAAELYRGDFLDGFYVSGAPAFEEWALLERERLRALALLALEQLAARLASQGEYAAALPCARRLLALEPWREKTHRWLMRLLVLTGQRGAALEQYETCRRILGEELGVTPDEATTTLYERVRSGGRPGQAAGAAPEAAAALPASFPFAGRAEEHARLLSLWKSAAAGRGKLTLIAGEAGVGKTRLAEEVARYAAVAGGVVLRGRCYEFGDDVPYQATAGALRLDLARAGPPAGLSPVWLAELARLLPELRDMRPALPAPLQVSGAAARQRLFEAVARFLAARAGRGGRAFSPVLFFLDDLHWAGQPDLDLLHYLTRRLAGEPVWLLAAYRPEEIGGGRPLTLLRQGLGRDGLVYHLDLAPLGSEAVKRVARALIGGRECASLETFLYRESEGNPFILWETAANLRETGALRPDDAGGWVWRGPPEREDLPQCVQDMLLQRVGRLSRLAREYLNAAAVIGRRFNLALLQATAGQGADDAAAALQEWLARRLARPLDAAEPFADHPLPGEYDFAHDKIRAVVYREIDAPQRRRLHRQAGEGMERLYAGRLEAAAAQIAYHFEQAGAADKAFAYLRLAADQAAAVYANEEALAYYRRALKLSPAEGAQRWDILLRQAAVTRLVGRHDQAAALCRQVLQEGEAYWPARAAALLSDVYRARRDYGRARRHASQALQLASPLPRPEGEMAGARALYVLGLVERELGNLDEAQKLFAEAETLSFSLDERGRAAESLVGQGKTYADRGRYAAARRQFEKALEVFLALGDRQGEAACLRNMGMAFWREGDNEAADRVYSASLRLCREIGDREGEAAALNGLGLVCIVRGAREETRRYWEESVAVYRELGLERRAAAGLHNLGILHITRRQYEAAQQYLTESLAIDRAVGARPAQALDLGWLGRLALYRGRHQAALAYLDEALAIDRETGGGAEQDAHLIWRGAAAGETGDLDGALRCLRRAIQDLAGSGLHGKMHEAYYELSRAHLARREGAEALAAAQAALEQAEASGDSIIIGSAWAHLGVVCASGLLADGPDPQPYFERGLAALPDNFDAAPCRVRALRAYGDYLTRQGELARGAACLEEAQAVCGCWQEDVEVEESHPERGDA